MTIDLNTKELWTVEEAAAYAGLSKDSIRDYVQAGYFRYYKPAGKVFIERTDFLAWMRSGEVVSQEAMDRKAYQHGQKLRAS